MILPGSEFGVILHDPELVQNFRRGSGGHRKQTIQNSRIPRRARIACLLRKLVARIELRTGAVQSPRRATP